VQVVLRVLAVQLVILVASAAVIWLFSRWGDDPELGGAFIALQALQAEVEFDPSGRPILPADGAVATIAKANPGFWYLVRTATGEIRSGTVPALLPDLDPSLQTSAATLMRDGDRAPLAFAMQGGLTIMAGPFTPGPSEKAGFLISLVPAIVGLGVVQLAGVFLALLLLPRDIRRAAQPLIDWLRSAEGRNRPGVHLPRELATVAAAADAVLLTLEQKITRSERFGGEIAHELRTPVTILRTQIEELGDGAQKRAMLVELSRMTEAISALLELARSDMNDRPPPLCDFALIVRQAIASRAPNIIATRRSISYLGPDGPVMAHVHAALVTCLVVNLIDNAVRHSASREIRVSLTGLALFEVADDGPSQGAGGCAPSESVGLGLALVRAIAERHGANFTLTNRPEGGKIARVAFQPSAVTLR
jgi:signal transduction histidine kinase